jgi:multidrug efflux system outer membrane protein
VRGAAALAACALLAACTVGPDYQRPEIEAPAQWRVEYREAAALANARWWQQYGDPALDRLVDDALVANHDLRIAAARIEQFLGALGTTRSRFYPQIGYGASGSRNRASRVGQPPLAPGADPYYSLYEGALSADWQIDLFGRVRRQSEAAQAQVLASEQGRRGVILSVVASVTASYIALRALDRQLEIARATAKNYAGTVELFERRHKGGVVSQLELSQVRSQYEQALAAIPGFELQISAQENLISVLLGRNPGPVARGRTIAELAAPAVPAGLPSVLLERRPDILQAEQNLVAANASIGVAKSLYYPSFSITGILGSISSSMSDFLSSPSAAYTVAAGVSGPLFTFGGIAGQVQSAEAAQREALAFYQQTVLNAFRETNDALYAAQKRGEEYEAQARRVLALREYARLSRARFDGGAASYLEVLYAESELFGAELTAVQTQAERHTQIINVYRALGGGWVDDVGAM